MIWVASGIYQIRNLVNGKIYIGSTNNAISRFRNHKYELRDNRHDNTYLQRAWNKYGEQSFVFEFLEYCEPNKLKLMEKENYWIKHKNCLDRSIGYNICIAAESQLGTKKSEETRIKMSAWQIGRKLSEETKAKIGNANRGKTHTESTKKRISELKTGLKQTEETKAKRRGRKHTPEALAKMRGRKRSQETKIKMSIAFTGRKYYRQRKQVEI